jgi:hypothetical protein
MTAAYLAGAAIALKIDLCNAIKLSVLLEAIKAMRRNSSVLIQINPPPLLAYLISSVFIGTISYKEVKNSTDQQNLDYLESLGLSETFFYSLGNTLVSTACMLRSLDPAIPITQKPLWVAVCMPGYARLVPILHNGALENLPAVYHTLYEIIYGEKKNGSHGFS